MVLMMNNKKEIIMSWYCQMVGSKQRCMEWKDYTKIGWDEANSFAVETIDGLTSRVQEKQDDE